jgi:hypothetical protein
VNDSEEKLPWDPAPAMTGEVATFETSEHTDKLDDALARAQAKVKGALKDKTNPAFRSKYADLSSVMDACQEALAEHVICWTQWPVHSEDGRLHLVTRLAHAGQWIRARMSLPVGGKGDAHAYGSALTYARRYALAAAVGVAPEDDDGNAASGRRDDRDDERKPPKSSGGDNLKKLQDSVRLKYEQLGGKSWMPWSAVLEAAAADGSASFDNMRRLDAWLKSQLGNGRAGDAA